MKKSDLLKEVIEHIDIASFDATSLIDSMRKMSFSSRDTAKAADIFGKMIRENNGTVILTLAGSTSAAGCMQVYADMIRYNIVDVVVATGASIIDMDFFEALGFRHYKGEYSFDDEQLRELMIDRIYDTLIDEEELQQCDEQIYKIAGSMEPGVYSSREFIHRLGEFLVDHAVKKDSLIELAYKHDVPIFCPAFSDSSAGFGLVKHQWENPDNHVSIDSVKDFRELTNIKMNSGETGLYMIGGGVPKNFIQDTVVCAELLGRKVPMHKFAVQVTVSDVRDGACSSSSLLEAASWGKVRTDDQVMVFAEATTVVPSIASYIYHSRVWEDRERRNWGSFFRQEATVRY